MSNLSPNQVILLRRFGAGWYRAGQLKGAPYGHPVAVENGLRPLVRRGLVTIHERWGTPSVKVYRLTNAGLAAQSAPNQAPNDLITKGAAQ